MSATTLKFAMRRGVRMLDQAVSGTSEALSPAGALVVTGGSL